jgi:hypothetical protein
MQALAGEAILTAWEQSQALPEEEAALAVLALALDENTHDLATLPLGERNALLLELRAATLGRRMDVFAVCPQCGEQMEFSVDPLELTQALRIPPRAIVEASIAFSMRPANTLDFLATRAAKDEEQAKSILLARTLVAGQPATASSEAWLVSQPPSRLAEWKARFEEMNAAAEIRFHLTCVACANAWHMNLDIANFLLREIAIAARGLMTEIHELASAYGWTERSIAAMSARRRAAYLERIGA